MVVGFTFQMGLLIAGFTPQRAVAFWAFGCKLHTSESSFLFVLFFGFQLHTSESSFLLGFGRALEHCFAGEPGSGIRMLDPAVQSWESP